MSQYDEGPGLAKQCRLALISSTSGTGLFSVKMVRKFIDYCLNFADIFAGMEMVGSEQALAVSVINKIFNHFPTLKIVPCEKCLVLSLARGH